VSVVENIDQDLAEAQKAQEADKVSTLRLLKNSLNAAAKEKKAELDDAEATKVVQKEAKQRRDSIDSFTQANRQDLVAKEQAELAIIEQYLPEQMSEDELNKLIEATIAETGANSMADMGKVMGSLQPKIAGQADGGQVAQLVKQKLAG
jgi:uncharacterized protein